MLTANSTTHPHRTRTHERAQVLKHFVAAEKEKLPSIVSLFDDVYADIPPHLRWQRDEMLGHIAKYPKEYPKGTRVQ